MKTKFILHGGMASHLNSENDAFFKEILKNAPDSPKILLVYFAKEEDRIPINKAEDIAQFSKNKGGKNPSYEIADKESFTKQLEKVDVVYLHGGATSKLLNTLKKFINLKELFEGKTIAGESAGAYALSSCFYSKKERGVFEGLGFVSVKTICHYIENDDDKLIEGCPDGLERLLLADYEYNVFYSK